MIKFDYLVLATGSTNAAGAFAQPQCTELAARRTELLGTADEVCRQMLDNYFMTFLMAIVSLIHKRPLQEYLKPRMYLLAVMSYHCLYDLS